MFGKKKQKIEEPMGKEEIEAQLALARAMKALAETIERATDPIRWQKAITDAMFSLAPLPQPEIQQTLARALPGGEATVQAISVAVSLTDEERQRLAKIVFEALKPQLEEFSKFTEMALKDMPPHRLKEIAEKVEAGLEPKLRRARGCVYIDFEGEHFGTYLNL